MAVTLQQILQTSFAAYAEAHKVPRRVWRAARALMACRTAALGGHVRRCPAGHVTEVWYNSCRHRACPADQPLAGSLVTAVVADGPFSRHLHPA